MKIHLKTQDASLQGLCIELLAVIMAAAPIWERNGLQTIQIHGFTRDKWHLGHQAWPGQVLQLSKKYLPDEFEMFAELIDEIGPNYQVTDCDAYAEIRYTPKT